MTRTTLEYGCAFTSKQFFRITYLSNISHVRLNIFPRGGISRLRIYGKLMHYICLPITNVQFDLVSRLYNSRIVTYSDCHEGHPNNILIPRKASIRTEGWVINKRTNESSTSNKEIEESEVHKIDCTHNAIIKL